MALECPSCGAQFDATLFAFDREVLCDCGERVTRETANVRRDEPPPDPERN